MLHRFRKESDSCTICKADDILSSAVVASVYTLALSCGREVRFVG